MAVWRNSLFGALALATALTPLAPVMAAPLAPMSPEVAKAAAGSAVTQVRSRGYHRHHGYGRHRHGGRGLGVGLGIGIIGGLIAAEAYRSAPAYAYDEEVYEDGPPAGDPRAACAAPVPLVRVEYRHVHAQLGREEALPVLKIVAPGGSGVGIQRRPRPARLRTAGACVQLVSTAIRSRRERRAGRTAEASRISASARHVSEIGRSTKIQKLPSRDDQRLAQVVLHQRAEHEGEHQRRRLVAELAHQVAEHAERDHDQTSKMALLDADRRRSGRTAGSAGTACCTAPSAPAPTGRSAAG